jgi:hypothetical protein
MMVDVMRRVFIEAGEPVMKKRPVVSPLLFALFAAGCQDAPTPPPARGLSSGATVTSTAVVVAEGIHIPNPVKRGQLFQASFGLRNTGSTTVRLAEVTLVVVKPDGSDAFPMVRATNVDVGPGGRWFASAIDSVGRVHPTGGYTAVVRGRLPGGELVELPVRDAQNGVNPASFSVVTSAVFGAVIPFVSVGPSTVVVGQTPQINATIRNTSTSSTQWGGAATFIITATLSRGSAVLARKEWAGESFGYDETRTGFAFPLDSVSLASGKYTVSYRVYSGDRARLFAIREAEFWVADAAPATGTCQVPPEVRHKKSYLAFWRAPYGFPGATPWLNVLHDTRGTGESKVEIDYIRLWARIGGVSRVMASNEYNNDSVGGELRLRYDWFKGTPEHMPREVVNGVLILRPGTRSGRVWHPYLAALPRANIASADSVWTEVRLRISGPALVQVGLDYWQHLDQNIRNEEAAATDWICAPGAWHTVTLEPSTEVAGTIQFRAADGSSFRVGSPITGIFTVRNRDDDTVRLAEIGLETRRLTLAHRLCDHEYNGRVDAFAWDRQNVVLPPNATVRDTADWIPADTGSYCVTVVERREGYGDDGYRRTRLRPLHQIIKVN